MPHGKPLPEQDQIGDELLPAASESRVLVAQTDGRRRSNAVTESGLCYGFPFFLSDKKAARFRKFRAAFSIQFLRYDQRWLYFS